MLRLEFWIEEPVAACSYRIGAICQEPNKPVPSEIESSGGVESQHRKSEEKTQKTGKESRDKSSESSRERQKGSFILDFQFPNRFPLLFIFCLEMSARFLGLSLQRLIPLFI